MTTENLQNRIKYLRYRLFDSILNIVVRIEANWRVKLLVCELERYISLISNTFESRQNL